MSDEKTEQERALEDVERICDIAVTEENTRLMREGGEHVVEHGGGTYRFGRAPERAERFHEEIPVRHDPPPVRAPELTFETTPAPAAEEPPAPRRTSPEEVRARVEEIRGRVSQHPRPAREDIGFLLTVLDAVERGSL